MSLHTRIVISLATLWLGTAVVAQARGRVVLVTPGLSDNASKMTTGTEVMWLYADAPYSRLRWKKLRLKADNVQQLWVVHPPGNPPQFGVRGLERSTACEFRRGTRPASRRGSESDGVVARCRDSARSVVAIRSVAGSRCGHRSLLSH
jgi:hypothetical protein